MSKPSRRVLRPLAPATYLWRNATKTVPLIGVIMLAVMLVAAIISMINSIPYSVKTIYSYSRTMLGVSPRGDTDLTPKVISIIQKESPVKLDRIINCRATSMLVHSIVGKWRFFAFGLEQKDLPYIMDRMTVRHLEGRLPRVDEPAVVVSQHVAVNLQLKIGSIILKPSDDENYSPHPVKVVGIADSPYWFVVSDIEYLRENHYPPVDLAMAFAHDQNEQPKLDHWAEKRFKGERAQVFAYHQIERESNEMFNTLYKILNVVIGTLALVITFMMGMLMNIYQSQRLVEFGLLQAIGYTKRQLLSRVLLESVAVIVLGWLFGVAAAFGGLSVTKHILMDPHGYALNVFDQQAYAYTLPLPIAILAVAVLTVWLRFRRFDPVAVVERRLV